MLLLQFCSSFLSGSKRKRALSFRKGQKNLGLFLPWMLITIYFPLYQLQHNWCQLVHVHWLKSVSLFAVFNKKHKDVPKGSAAARLLQQDVLQSKLAPSTPAGETCVRNYIFPLWKSKERAWPAYHYRHYASRKWAGFDDPRCRSWGKPGLPHTQGSALAKEQSNTVGSSKTCEWLFRAVLIHQKWCSTEGDEHEGGGGGRE